MSLATARVRDSARSALPRLRLLVTPPRVRRRPRFITTAAAILVGCLIVLLLLNIGLARGAYHEKQLTLQQTGLMESEQALSEEVARLDSPTVLAQKARDLGMIENPTPAFITLSDGSVLGEPSPAQEPAEDYEAASLTGRPERLGSEEPAGADSTLPPPDAAPPADERDSESQGTDTQGSGSQNSGSQNSGSQNGTSQDSTQSGSGTRSGSTRSDGATAPDSSTRESTPPSRSGTRSQNGDGATPVGGGR